MELLQTYQKHLNLQKAKERDEWTAKCPFHKEDTPSFYVNEKNGYFYCHGCGKGGGIKQFLRLIGAPEVEISSIKVDPIIPESSLKIARPISLAVIEQLHKNLIDDLDKIKYLVTVRHISFFTIKKFLLGYDTSTNRYAIPIKSRSGNFLNVKLHNSSLIPKCFYWQEGSKHKLFPFSSLLRNEIILCEGEFDCLALHSLGINAITQTSGASNWDPNWNILFMDKSVKIVYDTDNAGKSGAIRVQQELKTVTDRVQIIDIPTNSDEKQDVTTFIQGGGNIFKLLKMKRRQ